MTKKIKCNLKKELTATRVSVKVLKAPFVDTAELKRVIYARANALVI